MKWSNVKWVFLREIRDQLRDRRTMFTIAVLPLVLYPLLGMAFLQVAQFSREHPTKILVLGAEALPEQPELIVEGQFAEKFCKGNQSRLLKLAVPEAGDNSISGRSQAETAVQTGEYAAVLLIPDDFGSKLQTFRDQLESRAATAGPNQLSIPPVPQPEIFTSSASDKSRVARDRVERVLNAWRDAIIHQNLVSSQVPVAATQPFKVVSTDVARERSRRAAVWSKVLPFVVLIWALTGAFYPAVDLCAGEKERGTLETLLCSPAGRSEIVWGKLLTIMSFSIATSLLNMSSMTFTGVFIVEQAQRMAANPAAMMIGSPPLTAIFWIVVCLIPISALFSALSLAIAAFARSSKEGQYYLMPLLLITLPLMILPLLPTAELNLGSSLIPVTGMMLLLRALIEGQFVEALRFVVPVIGITCFCCLFAVRWAIDQFNDESVLFRESERWSLRIWLRHMVRDRRDTPSISEAIFCGVVLLLIRFFASFMVGMPHSWGAFATSTLVSLIAFVAAPALLMTVMLTRSPQRTLLLRMPRPMVIPMAILLAIVVHPLGLAIAEGVRFVYPFNAEIEQQLGSMGQLIGQAPSVWAILGVLALAPAICEELAFRGFILSGFRHMGHRWGAIVASSLFFGAAHSVLQQSMTAFAVGVVIGYVAVQTGSLIPGILFHLVYNSLSLLMAVRLPDFLLWLDAQKSPVWSGVSQMVQQFVAGDEATAYRWPAVAVSLCLTAAVLSWFRSLPFEVSPEEARQEALDHQSAQPAVK